MGKLVDLGFSALLDSSPTSVCSLCLTPKQNPAHNRWTRHKTGEQQTKLRCHHSAPALCTKCWVVRQCPPQTNSTLPNHGVCCWHLGVSLSSLFNFLPFVLHQSTQLMFANTSESKRTVPKVYARTNVYIWAVPRACVITSCQAPPV